MALSPQLPEQSAKIAKRNKLTFDVLSDPGNVLARQLGLVFELPDDLKAVYRDVFKIDLERFNGDDAWELPMPARIIIAADGTVAHVECDPDYTVRPEPETTVGHLREHLAG